MYRSVVKPCYRCCVVKNRQACRQGVLTAGSYSGGLFRSACGGEAPTSFSEAHSHSAAGPSDPALGPFAAARRVYSKQMRIDSFTVRNLTQNHRNFFHLNCVPRQASRRKAESTVRVKSGFFALDIYWGGAIYLHILFSLANLDWIDTSRFCYHP